MHRMRVTNCTAGWLAYKNACYFFQKENKTWLDSNSECTKNGGNLSSVADLGESNFIESNLNGNTYYIGLKRFKKNAEFLWSDGSPNTFSNWGNGQPDMYNEEIMCVAVYLKRWNDFKCDRLFGHICKVVQISCLNASSLLSIFASPSVFTVLTTSISIVASPSVFTVAPPSTSIVAPASIEWIGNWAFGCDFYNNDFAHAIIIREECGCLCYYTPDCTHYCHSSNDGTCYMKSGNVSKRDAFSFGGRTRMCGVVTEMNCSRTSITAAPSLVSTDVSKTLWKVLNFVTLQGYLLKMSLQIFLTLETSLDATVEFEYFLPPYFKFTVERVIQSFVNKDITRIKYIFNGKTKSSQLFNYNFTAVFNDTQCPIPGAFTLDIPLKIKIRILSGKSTVIYKSFRKIVECFGYPKIPSLTDRLVLEENYGRGIYWDSENLNVYVCMNQHFPSTKVACYISNDEGISWNELDVRVGSVLGHHMSTKELYAIHRNQKTYMVFSNIYNKWLSITNKQYKDTVSSFINPKMRINLEGNYDQIYDLGPNQWLGNAQGLFFRVHGNGSWVLRIKWRF